MKCVDGVLPAGEEGADYCAVKITVLRNNLRGRESVCEVGDEMQPQGHIQHLCMAGAMGLHIR